MEPRIVHHPVMTVIGFSRTIGCHEGFVKCPQFWDEAYARRFSRLFRTMRAETPEEQAVLDNRIGEFAVCRALPGRDSFEYMICGEYRGGEVPADMRLATVPESDWLEFTCRGALPKSIQELNTFVHQVWMNEHADEYQCRGLDIERYGEGDPGSSGYECAICIPVLRRRSLCGGDCGACPGKDRCPGCAASGGRPFGGACVLAACCQRRGHAACAECGGECGLKRRLMAEFNALHIPGMPPVTRLNALAGSFINLEYTLENGCRLKLWDDRRVYLGNQLEKTDGSCRCYGLTADEKHLLVCEYGDNGADPEIVVYQRRDQ